MYRDSTLTTKNAPFCTYDSNQDVGLIAKRELSTFTGNLAFKVTDNLELFGDALYSKSTVEQNFQPSPLRRSFMVTDALFAQQGVEPALVIRPTNPNYSVATQYLTAMEAANPGQGYGALIGQPLAVTARVFDFGGRNSVDVSKQSRLTGGLRGNFMKQDWELAVTQNENKVSGTVPNGYFSQVGFARVVNDAASDYNPWALQQSQAFNDALAASGAKYTGGTLEAKTKSTEFDSKISGEARQVAGRHPAICGRTSAPEGIGGHQSERSARHRRHRRPRRRHAADRSRSQGQFPLRRIEHTDRQEPRRQPGSPARRLRRCRRIEQLQGFAALPADPGSRGPGVDRYRLPGSDAGRPVAAADARFLRAVQRYGPWGHGSDRPPGQFIDRRQSEPEAREVEAAFDRPGHATDSCPFSRGRLLQHQGHRHHCAAICPGSRLRLPQW